MNRSAVFAITATVIWMLAPSPDANAQCPYQHPSTAKTYQVSFVQAFVSCGNPGGNVPNTTSSEGSAGSADIAACKPPETFNQQSASPAEGWTWGPKSKATLKMKPGKNKLSGPLDPPDSTDVFISLALNDIHTTGGGPAGSFGELSLFVRLTMNDRENGPMTWIDFSFKSPISMVDGKAKVKTSFNIFLHANPFLHSSLPHCSSFEILSATIYDPYGDAFGSAGLWSP